MSKVTPPGGAAAESCSVKLAMTVPTSPSVTVASEMKARRGQDAASPTHSSLPAALEVMMRTWTSGWPAAPAGSTAQT